mgnify:CR=1 FL=1
MKTWTTKKPKTRNNRRSITKQKENQEDEQGMEVENC